jgi:flagellar biosynthesis protein
MKQPPKAPPAHAAALSYNDADAAPRVVAKGYGDVAHAIIARAQEHGIYVHQSPELVRLLMRIDLDERIPPELYRAVAELLAWVYELERTAADRD